MKLTTRIMMLVVSITLLMGILVIVLSGPVIKQGFRAMDKEWIESLTASLAEGIAHDTINGNAARAHQLLEAVVLRNRELDYAYVVDFDRSLFAHTFEDGFPEKLLDVVRADHAHQSDHHHPGQIDTETLTDKHVHSTKLRLDGEDVADVSYPLVEGMSARLHLGLNDKADEALIQAIGQQLVMIILALGLLGILLAFPVSRQLTRPLERFGRLMQDYGDNNLEGQVDISQGSSEIKKLGKAFNQMIESRSHAEDALHDISELNERIISESPIGLAIYDHTGQCIAANTSVAKMIGATQEQVLEQNYKKIESWKKGGLFDAANESIRQQEKVRHEFDVVTTFGKQAFFDCLFVPFKSQDDQHLLLMLDDISDRKEGERKVTEHIERLQTLSELSMSLTGDPAEVFKDVVRMIARLLDVRVVCLSEIRGDELYFISVYVDGDVMADAGHCPLSITPCATVECSKDFRIYDQVAEKFPKAEFLKAHNAFSYCGFPSLNNKGEVVSVTCLLDDKPHKFTDEDQNLLRIFGQRIATEIETQRHLNEKRQAEQELQKHRHHLEELVEERTKELRDTQDELVRKERLAALGQLTATVSHELRNPLASMRPSLYFIRKKIGMDDDQLIKTIERLDRNVSRCDHIIDELLDFTRVTDMELEVVVLDDWLTGVLSEQTIHPDIRFIQALSLGDCQVEIDVNRLRRAVNNVIENSCHAMQEENDPDRIRPDSQLTVETVKEEGRIEIRIQDAGVGIPEDVLSKIFEPLYSTKSFGIGLGMSIIKQIMEQHGGGIEINSEQGKGTSVVLWLPRKVSGEVAA